MHGLYLSANAARTVRATLHFCTDCNAMHRTDDQSTGSLPLRLDVRKFTFSNRVINDWNSVSLQCINCCTVNTFKNIFQLNWNRKLINYISCVLFEIVGVLWRVFGKNVQGKNVHGKKCPRMVKTSTVIMSTRKKSPR